MGCLPLVEDRMERKWFVYGKIDSIWWRWGLNPSVADRRGLRVGRYLEKWTDFSCWAERMKAVF